MPETDYNRWISYTATSEEEIAAIERQVEVLGYLPRFSLVLVVSDVDEVWVRSTIGSVLEQLYPHLELCICDNGTSRPHVAETLREYAETDERVKVERLPVRRSWAEAHNAAVAMAEGDYVALLDQGDELAPEALFKVAEHLQYVRPDIIYTNEDWIDLSSRRSDPVFKPYWSPDLLLSTAYIGRLCVMRREMLDTPSGPFREGFEGAEEYDLLLRLSEQTKRIRHLPEMLYHRRRLAETSEAAAGPDQAALRALEDAVVRREINATLRTGLAEGSFRIVRRPGGRPRVSVIIASPEGAALSLPEELSEKTSYPVHQVIVATNGREVKTSGDRVSHPSMARALNLAAGEAEGELLVFMDFRAQVTDDDWLFEMVREVRRPEVGAVGARVMNPSGGVRDGGSMVELNRLTGYVERPVYGGGRYLPLVDYPFNFGAASAECMMVRRGLFERVGGFDDENLPSTFYDLDLSFRFRELGLLNVYTPYARVVCRGNRPAPGREEIEYMWKRWWERLVQTLYYQRSPLHPGHHALDREALSVLPL